LAKGLEFRAVAVMARHDEIIPSQEASRMSPTMPISKSQASIRISRDLLN
jgi:hypothetical protein